MLEEANYIEVEKRFVGRKPNTVCRVSYAGREAFMAYLDQLEDVIRSVKLKHDLT